MQYIRLINDSIWKSLFKLFRPVSDNAAMVMLTAASFFLLGWILINRVKKLPCFGPTEFLFVLSAGFMIERLPMIHRRIHLALGTTAGILMKSEDYINAFESASGITVDGTKSIASYLYFLKDRKDILTTEPAELYEHLFSALDKVRHVPILGDVHVSSFGTWSVMFVLVVMVALGMLLAKAGKPRWVFLQAAFLIWTTTYNNGAALCAVFLWIAEEGIRYFAEECEKAEPGSAFRRNEDS